MIRIAIGGDFCPLGLSKRAFPNPSNSGEQLFEGVKEALKGNDMFVLNLECPLTESSEAIEKVGPSLKAHPANIELLKYLGVDLVTLANNHVMDYGHKGLGDTIALCTKHGIDTVGADLTMEAARRIHYRKIKGRDLAIINATEGEFASATLEKGGANPIDIISLVEDIREARQRASHVILILHGGLDSTPYPSPRSVKVLRFLAEQGLSAIIRHHPHLVQGFEVWKGVPIFYSLGNFYFNWYTTVPKKEWHEGMLIVLCINEDDSCTFEIHPFEQSKEILSLRMLAEEEKSTYLKRLNDYSSFINNENLLQAEWTRTLNARREEYFGLLAVPNDLVLRALRRLGVLRFVVPMRRTRLLIENYLRCDTHREALLGILERLRTSKRKDVRTMAD